MFNSTEMSNSPNPILEYFRLDSQGVTGVNGVMEWLYMEDYHPTPNATLEHFDHARRVLEKLVAVYGGEE